MLRLHRIFIEEVGFVDARNRSMEDLGPPMLVPRLFPTETEYVWGNITYTLSPTMVFSQGHMVSIACYSVLFIISAIGNISVLILLLRQSMKIRSRINYMLIHLAVADLMVTFILMPMEIVWAATVSWWGGDLCCRIMQFFRTFGLYQSSFVLVCIAIDRYNAVLKPLMLSAATKTGRTLIKFSWVTAALCSLPQTVLFGVHKHPEHPWYEQCMSINSLIPNAHELVTYSIFNMLIMYILPLAIITYCYGSILKEICKQADKTDTGELRRSTKEFLAKAKTRTFRMTVTLILAFFACWTPYYFITLWYFIDRPSAEKVDYTIQRALFIFASANSSINPIVYGVFNIRRRKTVRTRTRESNITCTTDARVVYLNGTKNDLSRRGSEQVVLKNT
ncbi:hormone receptor [Nesidiocoris tenuis]|uniref:Hormone receptor n=1 Tax=Nesidiocoris tenuis TaxID=355587 RepID=A0ABN7AFV9_9HEMI|nr:hormone receptor [Nesidiocoris tenuis]